MADGENIGNVQDRRREPFSTASADIATIPNLVDSVIAFWALEAMMIAR